MPLFDNLPQNELAAFLYNGGVYYTTQDKAPCFSCGTLTNWYSISFIAHICSTECADKEWAAYFEAERTS